MSDIINNSERRWFSHNIKIERDKLGLTQKEFAQYLSAHLNAYSYSIAATTVSAYEDFRRAPHKKEKVHLIEQALGLDEGALLQAHDIFSVPGKNALSREQIENYPLDTILDVECNDTNDAVCSIYDGQYVLSPDHKYFVGDSQIFPVDFAFIGFVSCYSTRVH